MNPAAASAGVALAAPVASSLTQFQDQFAQALLAPESVPTRPGATDLAGPVLTQLTPSWLAQPGFAVYRNTVFKGCVDALLANYPAVLRLVGSDWLSAVAADYARAHLPNDSRLLLYGADFASFLQPYANQAELGYLPGVARLDRCWTEAHSAADAQSVTAELLSGMDPSVLGQLVLRPHPATRWAWFESQPIYSLWSRNREPLPGHADAELRWQSEGALLTRIDGAVQWCGLSAGGCALLDACAAQTPLGQAAEGALACQSDLDVASLLAQLLQAGAFAANPTPTAS